MVPQATRPVGPRASSLHTPLQMPLPVRMSFSWCLLLSKPAPQSSVRGFFTVNLHVQTALFQMLDLLRIEVDGSTDRAFHRLGDRQLADRVAAHPAHDAVAKLHFGGVGFQ